MSKYSICLDPKAVKKIIKNISQNNQAKTPSHFFLQLKRLPALQPPPLRQVILLLPVVHQEPAVDQASVEDPLARQLEDLEKGGEKDHFAVHLVLEAPFSLGRGFGLFAPKTHA